MVESDEGMIELILVTAEKDSQGPDEKLSIEDI